MAIKATNQIDLIDLTDGYSVVLTNESHTFNGDTTRVYPQQSVTFKVIALCGAEIRPCTVGSMTTPTGVSAVSDGKTPNPTVTVTATTSCTAPGTITVPVTVDDVTIEKTFSFAIAFKGATGQNGTNGTSVTITSKSIQYQASSSGTTPPTGTWTDSIPSVSAGQFLWTRTVVNYSDGNSTTSYSSARSGTNGTNGTNGRDGADALTLTVTSSGGVIFKNTAVATTLTAKVFKGGVEVTGTALSALGTINWYKNGGTTAVASGQTLTVAAGDVLDRATYEARLEG